MKEWIITVGYAWEVDWQDSLRFSDFDETQFLREVAWVILSAGFSSAVVRKHFLSISEAFCCFRNAAVIVDNRDKCRRNAIKVFANRRKIDAIIDVAVDVCTSGFQETKSRINEEGYIYLQGLSQIGPVSAVHLMKNLGLDVIKPDRHLIRAAQAAGYDSPESLCKVISEVVGDRLSVVDLVIWRFATLRPDYCAVLSVNPPAPNIT